MTVRHLQQGASMGLQILEKDEAGRLTASYVTSKRGDGTDRVDITVGTLPAYASIG